MMEHRCVFCENTELAHQLPKTGVMFNGRWICAICVVKLINIFYETAQIKLREKIKKLKEELYKTLF